MSGYIQAGDMVRLNAAQRVQNIPESISPYCIDTDQLEMASRYRIIVSTCSTAGQLYSLGLRPGHITHVFIDEVCRIDMRAVWVCLFFVRWSFYSSLWRANFRFLSGWFYAVFPGSDVVTFKTSIRFRRCYVNGFVKLNTSLSQWQLSSILFSEFITNFNKRRSKKDSESPWGIEPQTFVFRAPMLYYWAKETLRWARSITKFIWHTSYILLGSAMSIALWNRCCFSRQGKLPNQSVLLLLVWLQEKMVRFVVKSVHVRKDFNF